MGQTGVCHNRAVDAYQSLEWKLADQKCSRLLVATDFTESHGTRLIAARVLDTSSGRRVNSGSLGWKLLARSLATGGLLRSLLGAGHCEG